MLLGGFFQPLSTPGGSRHPGRSSHPGLVATACPSIFPWPFLFFFFKIYLFTFIFGLTGSLLLYTGFLQLRRVGATL